MKKLLLLLSLVLIGSSVSAELRVWSLSNGQTLEAEFVALVGGKISLRNARGKTIKLPESAVSQEDRSYIELLMPPKLDLSISRKTRQRIFPDSLSELPTAQYYDFKAVIKQTSTKQYNHPLTAELFVIGEEKAGDKQILLDYQKESFELSEGSKSVYQLPSKTIELTEFVMNGQLRGEIYAGCLIIVTDPRGEVVAYKTKSEFWFEKVENLRKVPIGKYFDKECNRAWPTRPKRFY